MSPASPSVTVLMPVHNGAEFIRSSSESILGQTLRDLELLVVNDGSTDGTAAILSDLAATDSRVRVIGGAARLGFSGALNLGLDEVRGEFIARMDADDIALPDRLEAQYEFLRSNPDVGLCGGGVEKFGLKQGAFHRPPVTPDETLCYALFDNPFAHPTVMLRRGLVQKHGLRYDPAYCPSDDYELWSRCLRLFPCANLDRVVLQYRVHATSMSEADWGEMDRLAAQIAARELAALGVSTGADSIRFHRNLGRGRCFPIRAREELDRAEQWLRGLIAANERAARYPAAALSRVCGDVWYRACYHAGALGAWSLRRYRASNLRRARHTSVREWIALLRVGRSLRLSRSDGDGSA